MRFVIESCALSCRPAKRALAFELSCAVNFHMHKVVICLMSRSASQQVKDGWLLYSLHMRVLPAYNKNATLNINHVDLLVTLFCLDSFINCKWDRSLLLTSLLAISDLLLYA
jgi:hypothetical protein